MRLNLWLDKGSGACMIHTITIASAPIKRKLLTPIGVLSPSPQSIPCLPIMPNANDAQCQRQFEYL